MGIRPDGSEPASKMQRRHYKILTGDDLPPNATRLSAAAAVDFATRIAMATEKRVLAKLDRGEASIGAESKNSSSGGSSTAAAIPSGTAPIRPLETPKSERKRECPPPAPATGRPSDAGQFRPGCIRETVSPADGPSHGGVAPSRGRPGYFELLEGRCYAVEADQLSAEHLDGVTLVVTMGVALKFAGRQPEAVLELNAENYVDERLFEGAVRLVASTVRGDRQKVLLIGQRDPIQVISLCVLREFLGVDATTASRILRGSGAPGLQEEALMRTAEQYRVS